MTGRTSMIVVLVACGLCAALLAGWSVAWYYDHKRQVREREEAEMQAAADAARTAKSSETLPDSD